MSHVEEKHHVDHIETRSLEKGRLDDIDPVLERRTMYVPPCAFRPRIVSDSLRITTGARSTSDSCPSSAPSTVRGPADLQLVSGSDRALASPAFSLIGGSHLETLAGSDDSRCGCSDRTNISLARVAGMLVDLKLGVGERYSLISLMFFIPYIVSLLVLSAADSFCVRSLTRRLPPCSPCRSSSCRPVRL